LRPASDEQREAGPNIGYWLGEPYWGQGYMTEAAGALCREIFAASTAPTTFSGLFDGNPASLAVQAKLGFVVTGRSMKFSNVQQKELPHINTELTRAAFAGRLQ
jgi:RimJ/RimL family protein N-acetyltransferase